MKKIILMISVLAVTAMLILTFGGCKNVASDFVEKAIEDAAAKEGEDVDIDIEEGKVNITDEEGNEISIGGTDIPDGWPAEIPVDNNITIQFAGSQKVDNKMSYSISGLYKGAAEDLYNFYKSSLIGFTVDSDTVTGSGDEGKTYSLVLTSNKYTTSVFITDKDGEVTVVMSVNEL